MLMRNKILPNKMSDALPDSGVSETSDEASGADVVDSR